MKKRVVSVLLVVMVVVTLVACGSSKIDGTWVSTAAKANGKEVKWSDLPAAAASKKITLAFDGDKVTAEVAGNKADGTFKIDGDTVTLNDGKSDIMTLKIEGDRLSLAQAGGFVYFEKQ